MTSLQLFRATAFKLSLGIVFVGSLASCATTPPSMDPNRLEGNEWLAIELEGRDVEEESGLTLRFTGTDAVKGNAACSEFSAPVQTKGNTIAFGPVTATEEACDTPIMNIDKVYFEALKKVRIWEIDVNTLRLKNGDGVILLRFHGQNV